MPDPSLSDALAEAQALAPADEIIHHTIEIRHPSFVDETGAADSIWVVRGTEDLSAPIEADAPVKGGQTIDFVPFAFDFNLMPIEAGATSEIGIDIDAVDRRIVEALDLAVESAVPIDVVYRPYLESDVADGPQMDPPPAFELSDVHVGTSVVKGKARTGIDLRGAFPRRNYTAREVPGLIGA